MKVGRKLIYDLVSGEVLKDTGEREGSVMDLPIEVEYPEYNSEEMGVLYFPFGVLREEFRDSKKQVVNGFLVVTAFETAPRQEGIISRAISFFKGK